MSAHSARDLGSIPGLGRSPGEGNGNPLQYSCLENSVDGGTWWATIHGIAKSQTGLSDFTFTLSRMDVEFCQIHTLIWSYVLSFLDCINTQVLKQSCVAGVILSWLQWVAVVCPVIYSSKSVLSRARPTYKAQLFSSSFWLHHTPSGILVPWPGIESWALISKSSEPNHWTAREFPQVVLLSSFFSAVSLILSSSWLLLFLVPD